MTTAGDWSLNTKAKKRTRFIDGQFQHARAYEARRRAVKNMALIGTGFVKSFQQHGKQHYESIFPGEIKIDDHDGFYADPRTLIQEKIYDRAVAMKLWPSAASKIKAEGTPDARYFGRDPLADQILVREAWHLPSSPDAGDGRHVICITDATLFSEKWEIERFPFAVWRWSEEPLGYFGTGIGHQLSGLQREINSLLLTIQSNSYYGGNLKAFVEKGSGVALAHITNQLKIPIIEYTGRPPVIQANDIFTPQLFQLLQYYVESAYQISGIAQAQAQSEMPASIQSGRQAQIYANQYSRRFMTVLQGDEQAMMDLARLTLDTAAEIEEEYGDLYVAYQRNRNWMERIEAKDILGDDDEFELTAGSTSVLPRTAAGKQAMLEGWQQMGWMTPGEARRAMDVPDLDAVTDLENAPAELIDQRIEKILENGDATMAVAHPRMNLEMAYARALLAFNKAEQNGVPPDRLDLLDQFIDSIELEIEHAQTPAAPEASAPVPPGLEASAVPPGLPPEAPPVAMPPPGAQIQ
jgi:hypothetical protein